jgi:hypothetical protein
MGDLASSGAVAVINIPAVAFIALTAPAAVILAMVCRIGFSSPTRVDPPGRE